MSASAPKFEFQICGLSPRVEFADARERERVLSENAARLYRLRAERNVDALEWRERVAYYAVGPADFKAVARVVRGRRVLEVCAGRAYLARLLAHAPDVEMESLVVTDIQGPPPANSDKVGVCVDFTGVRYERASAAEAPGRFPADVLLVAWPPYDDPAADNALAAFAGDAVVFIGEKRGDATANDAFFARLASGWAEEPVRADRMSLLNGFTDTLRVFRRRPRTVFTAALAAARACPPPSCPATPRSGTARRRRSRRWRPSPPRG